MRLQDALYNWLQMKLVVDARPTDNAAKETEAFFSVILKEDHELEQVAIGSVDEESYSVHYVKNGERHVQKFDREAADQLLIDINANPKYNE